MSKIVKTLNPETDMEKLYQAINNTPITCISPEGFACTSIEKDYEVGKRAGIRAVYDAFNELQSKKKKQIVPSMRNGKMYTFMLCKLCEEIKDICLKLEDDI